MTERERIMQVMTQKGLTSSQFAESIGIQRAAMSHITSGRNNPSLDVMKKILERFPDAPPTSSPPPPEPPPSPTPEVPEQPKIIAREVDRILLFYSDGTFESFVPERKEPGEV